VITIRGKSNSTCRHLSPPDRLVEISARIIGPLRNSMKTGILTVAISVAGLACVLGFSRVITHSNKRSFSTLRVKHENYSVTQMNALCRSGLSPESEMGTKDLTPQAHLVGLNRRNIS
jgi:hypothetical protein